MRQIDSQFVVGRVQSRTRRPQVRASIVLLQSSKIYVSTYRTSCSHIYKIQYVIVLRVTHAQDQDQRRWGAPSRAIGASLIILTLILLTHPINTTTLRKLVSSGHSRLRGGCPISGWTLWGWRHVRLWAQAVARSMSRLLRIYIPVYQSDTKSVSVPTRAFLPRSTQYLRIFPWNFYGNGSFRTFCSRI